MPKKHRTIRTPVDVSVAGENGCRLDAWLVPAATLDQAEKGVSEHQRQWTGWAWRGHARGIEASGVEGERHRGIGEALLEVLESANLRGAVLVVVRSVADAPLNRRETIRVYEAAGEAAVRQAAVIEAPLWVPLTVGVGGSDRDAVERAIQSNGGRIRGAEARSQVTLWLEVAAEDEAALRRAVASVGGRVR